MDLIAKTSVAGSPLAGLKKPFRVAVRSMTVKVNLDDVWAGRAPLSPS